MSEHGVTVQWQRGGATFSDDRYSRVHQWRFDGGATVHASASPQVVPIPLSDESAVDPEEAFVASLSSCHMLWFLAVARTGGYVVESYLDAARGKLARDAAGNLAITDVWLNPLIVFAGEAIPDAAQLAALHAAAHSRCFIARSVKTRLHIR